MRIIETFDNGAPREISQPTPAQVRQYAEVTERLRPGQTLKMNRTRKGGPVLIISTPDEIVRLVDRDDA
jgi:hypothetical protein